MRQLIELRMETQGLPPLSEFVATGRGIRKSWRTIAGELSLAIGHHVTADQLHRWFRDDEAA
jgi:hypothetical protein